MLLHLFSFLRFLPYLTLRTTPSILQMDSKAEPRCGRHGFCSSGEEEAFLMEHMLQSSMYQNYKHRIEEISFSLLGIVIIAGSDAKPVRGELAISC
jgi:hypothetical protein